VTPFGFHFPLLVSVLNLPFHGLVTQTTGQQLDADALGGSSCNANTRDVYHTRRWVADITYCRV